ncbi:MAG TPA: MBL fold metallo-hydrolase [Acidimicrobiales bacterium]|nr:MBL fold metallo-hydrolase [Acidimicrobiales bacterium]
MNRLVELSPGLLVATSRREMTTSTVIVSPAGQAVVVDPAWDPDELAGLAGDLSSAGITVAAGVATHFHHDHLLWHPDLGPAPRWASPGTVAIARRHRSDLLGQLGADWPGPLGRLFADVRPLPPRTPVPWSGPPIEVVAHRAHAPGHLALWCPAVGVLVAGDMLSDVELPLPDPEDAGLVGYRGGLEALAGPAAAATWVVPGHGRPTTEGRHRLEADRRYLDAVMAGLASDDPRLALPGMAEADALNRRLAAA